MKRYPVLVAILLSAIGLIAPVSVKAEAKVQPQTLTGTLSVEKDFDDAVVKISFSAAVKDGDGNDVSQKYNVVLDANGKKLAALDGKKIEVTAVVGKKEVQVENDEGETEKKIEMWLTVKSYKVIEEKAAPVKEEEPEE